MQFSTSEVVGQVSCSCEDRTSSTVGTFSPRFPDTATKGWYRHDQREMFVKMSLRDRLDCLIDFFEMIVLCLLSPCLPYACGSLPPTAPFRLRPPSPNCFFRVCFPTLFAADLKDFLPLFNSPISGAANSNMSAPMRFATRTTYLRKNGIAVLPITCARAPSPVLLCLPIVL